MCVIKTQEISNHLVPETDDWQIRSRRRPPPRHRLACARQGDETIAAVGCRNVGVCWTIARCVAPHSWAAPACREVQLHNWQKFSPHNARLAGSSEIRPASGVDAAAAAAPSFLAAAVRCCSACPAAHSLALTIRIRSSAHTHTNRCPRELGASGESYCTSSRAERCSREE